MRPHRLLSGHERGSAAVESVFAIVMLIVIVLGALQVAFALYARNVLASAAHEGVRAALERGAVAADAAPVVAGTVRRAAGGLVDDVAVTTSARGGTLTVRVQGTVDPVGPVPISIPLVATASAALDPATR
jgi:Flp pilus assembly protein TadG